MSASAAGIVFIFSAIAALTVITMNAPQWVCSTFAAVMLGSGVAFLGLLMETAP